MKRENEIWLVPFESGTYIKIPNAEFNPSIYYRHEGRLFKLQTRFYPLLGNDDKVVEVYNECIEDEEFMTLYGDTLRELNERC
jgi:hypothetical protein